MTQIITRYFDSVDQAQTVYRELVRIRRFSPRILSLYSTADGLADKLTATKVDPKTSKAYQKRVQDGGAVLLVRAGYKPLSVAQAFRDVTAEMGAADLGDLVEEVTVKDKPTYGLSVLADHPHMLTRPIDSTDFNPHMADWPIPLISRRKPFRGSVIEPHGHMASWPFPLLSDRKPYAGSIIAPHARMANFLLPLLSDRKPYDRSIFARHARMANFPIPLISRRKPYTGSLFPRHQRVANWPFPHLINGKTGTNALIPGGPRMANFPISLLSARKPYDKSIFGRHARMANFPFPLISRRIPFSGSAFPRHARMADAILPLIIRRSDAASPSKGSGFSFSRLLGLPTIIRR